MPHGNYIDPTTVRLSDHFLLSDLMGCHSVYTKGYPNVFDGDAKKLREGKALCENVLEPLLEYSRLSISYGYISPDLSRRIVKYQDPNKPSYHRWDAGAACDVVLHERIALDEAPIASAFWIDENLPVSRVITYSESPFICVASRLEEIRSGDYRRALYENRYIGERKPKYIAYSDNPTTRRRQKQELQLDYDWQGTGYPTYHGGGIEQAQHIRTSNFTMLSDFLFSSEALAEGGRNYPTQRSLWKFKRAGAIYDQLLELLNASKLSIIRAWESTDWSDTPFTWGEDIWLQIVPSVGIPANEVAEAAMAIPEVHTTGRAGDIVSIGIRMRDARK